MACILHQRLNDKRIWLTTASQLPMATIRYTPGNSASSYTAPAVMQTYNTAMSGVDLANQFAAKNTPNRKTMRWWVVFILHIFQTAAANAYLLARSFGHEAVKEGGDRVRGSRVPVPTATFTAFRDELALQLIDCFSARSRQSQRPVEFVEWHNQEQTVATDGAKRRPRGDCSECCHRSGARSQQKLVAGSSRTTFYCVQCTAMRKSGRCWVCSGSCWQAHVERHRSAGAAAAAHDADA